MPKSVRGVMHEFKEGELHSGSSAGPVVKNRKQAVAIALSEQRQMGKKAKPAADPNHESYAYDWRAQQHPHKNLGKFLHKAK